MAEKDEERRESEDIERKVDKKTTSTPVKETLECAVCLQPCVHPVQLYCGHIFCYLCVKGVANQSKRCAMCRQEIPPDFLNKPQLIEAENAGTAFEDGCQWFYEGRNGWWQYDERTSTELETAFKKETRNCELLIAGFLYTIDFESMVQYRRNEPSRRRRIKRDFASIPKKGVAGLRVQSTPVQPVDLDNRETADGEERVNNVNGVVNNSANSLVVHVARSLDMSARTRERVKSPSPTLIPPTNTPQTPHTPSANSGRSSPDVSDDSSVTQRFEDLLQNDVGVASDNDIY
uniref:E3 ubiquitin-protein ligase n=1 Tax=Strigamia maritima TaxID=126957 RepID=T1JPD1_STRMM